MRYSVLAVTALAVGLLCATVARAAEQSLLWRSSSVELELVTPVGASQELSARLRRAAEEAARGWATDCGAPSLRVVTTSDRIRGAARDDRNTIAFLRRSWCRAGRPSGPCYDERELGATTLFAGERPRERDRLVEADIEVNAVRWGFLGDRARKPAPVELTWVLAHEMGHALGLSHRCDAGPAEPGCKGTIMTAAAHRGTQLGGPSEADRAHLCRVYAQRRATASSDHGAPAPAERSHGAPESQSVPFPVAIGLPLLLVVASSRVVRRLRRQSAERKG